MQVDELMWAEIEGFSKYEVSNTGIVINVRTGREVKHSRTQAGQIKVGLVDDQGTQKTKLVKNLVASNFVQGESDVFNTVISLDGDQSNVHYTNLMWRPRWFALQWARQHTRVADGKKNHYLTIPVYDISSKEYFDNIHQAAMANGSAHSEILVSCVMLYKTWPDNRKYRFIDDDRLGEIGTPEEHIQINF